MCGNESVMLGLRAERLSGTRQQLPRTELYDRWNALSSTRWLTMRLCRLISLRLRRCVCHRLRRSRSTFGSSSRWNALSSTRWPKWSSNTSERPRRTAAGLSDNPEQPTRTAEEPSCTGEKLTCTTQEQNLDTEGINRRRGKQNSKTEQLNGTTGEQNVKIDNQFNQFEALNVEIQKLNRTPKQVSRVPLRQSFITLFLRQLRVPERLRRQKSCRNRRRRHRAALRATATSAFTRETVGGLMRDPPLA